MKINSENCSIPVPFPVIDCSLFVLSTTFHK